MPDVIGLSRLNRGISLQLGDEVGRASSFHPDQARLAASVLGEQRKMFGQAQPMLSERLCAGGKTDWRLEGDDNFALDIFLSSRGTRQPSSGKQGRRQR